MTNFKSVYFTFLLTFFIIKIGLPQQLDLPFTSYSSSNGLSSSTITSIYKDSFGFLWFGTEDGLNRFDGINFKIYKHDPIQNNGLTVNHITALYESIDGVLWIGTNGGGLSYYDRTKDSIYNYRDENLIVSPAITSIKADKKNNIWITAYGGLFMIDPKTRKVITDSKYDRLRKYFDKKNSLCFFQDSKYQIWIGTREGLYLFDSELVFKKHFKNVEGDPTSLSNNMINSIVEDNKGNIWIATDKGLSMQKANEGQFYNIYNIGSPKISSSMIFSLALDKYNRLWIGTDEGLDILNTDTNSINNYVPDKRNPFSLPNRSIRSIFIDNEGLYWIGSFHGGVSKYDENFNQFYITTYNPFDPLGLRSPIVSAFAAGTDGIFVGTDGGGLHFLQENTNTLRSIDLPVPIKNNNKQGLSILTMEMAKNNILWIGTFSNGLYTYNTLNKQIHQYKVGSGATELNSTDIFSIKEDNKGNIWVGTNGGGVNLIRPGSDQVEKFIRYTESTLDNSQPSSNFIRAIEQDNSSRMWIGTYGSGISVFDPQTKKFSFYTKATHDLPSDYILSIKEDSKGNIWVGSNGNGIGMLKKGTQKFVTFSEINGVENGVISMILEDKQGKLWFSTNKGLSCYDPAAQQFKNYTHYNGLPSGAFIRGAGIALPSGELYFGSNNGFVHFNPTLFKTNKNVPKVVFTDLKIDNQPVPVSKDGPISQSILLAEKIHLKHKQAFLIAFEALNFTVSEENQFEYKLDGFDKDWIKAGKDHSAYYTNLNPGEYVFHVRASNNDGVWNPTDRSILIIVAPPLWRTTYAYILYVVLIVGTLLYFRKRGIDKLHAKFALEQERKETKQLREQERKEAEHLHKLDQMKIKFLTNLSHEFRTPISLILSPVDSILSQISDSNISNQLLLVKRNAKRLLNLVNQLLDFRKMEEKELKLQCTSGDFTSFIEDVCDSFKDLAQRKKISFSFNTTAGPLFTLFDHDKIERIMFNLLSNAFKFTSENGSIKVTLNEIETSDTTAYRKVAVSVADTGIGIPEEDRAMIFENFFQHNTGSDILNQGTGIGLAITKEFVKQQGGTLHLESEVGKGSTFSFQLRLQSHQNIQQELQEDHPATKEIEDVAYAMNQNKDEKKQLSLLIVEDDDDFRFYIKENLKNSYQIIEAANGKEGWQRALFHHPDIIICDIQMPIMNGLELVQKIKSDKRTKHIPVIILTASNSESGQLGGLEAGATDYITKPFDFAVLKVKIKNLLILNQTFKTTYSKQVTIKSAETTPANTEKDNFLEKAHAYVYENMDNPQLSVESLSIHLCISRASLYNRLLELTGVSPVEFIRNVKIEKAVSLLEKSDMTIAEIAYETGFANPNYFTKVFKTKYNMTPTEFVQERKKEKKNKEDS